MRVATKNGLTYDLLVNGKQLPTSRVFEGLVALATAFFPFVVVTKDNRGAVRAVTFSRDRKYIDQLTVYMEPGSDESMFVLNDAGEVEND